MTRYDPYISLIDSLYSDEQYVSSNDFDFTNEKISECSMGIGRLLVDSTGLIFQGKAKLAVDAFKKRRLLLNKLATDRDHYNQRYVHKMQQRGMQCEGKPLDHQQIESVVANEDLAVTYAAAGSGKTTTVIAKIKHLTDLGVHPSRILALSFTRKSATELGERAQSEGISGVRVGTFHSVGNEIYKAYSTGDKKVVSENQSNRLIKECMAELLKSDDFLDKYNRYLLFFYTAQSDPLEHKTTAEHVEFNRASLEKPLKAVSMDKRAYNANHETTKGDFVRSKEEQIIADFLFINRIPYEYEALYPFTDYKYRPDFTLPILQDKKLYLEHFAISRNFTAPAFFKDPIKYVTQIHKKRATHQKYGTTLIESYSYEWSEGTLLTNLEGKIRHYGAIYSRMSNDEIHHLMKEARGNTINSFNEFCITFMVLFKNRYSDLNEYEKHLQDMPDNYQKVRALHFFEIFEDIYSMYQAKLSENKLYDFADMLVASADLLHKAPASYHQYDYILVDEAQDISYGRFLLLKELLKRNDTSKLYCVGDDWQSIFRFTGADLSILQQLDALLIRTKHETFIEQTYRFGEETALLSSEFIKKNKTQSQKRVIPNPATTTPIHVRLYDNHINREYETKKLEAVLREIVLSKGRDFVDRHKITVLGRYESDLDTVLAIEGIAVSQDPTNPELSLYSVKISGVTINIEFLTIHKSKGITRPIVVVLGCNDSSRGFPAKQKNDPLLETLLAYEDAYVYAEERRLFYVAITRARHATYLIGSKENPSQFVAEIKPNDLFADIKRCPECKEGKLVERQGVTRFLGCTNYSYGCDYTAKIDNGTTGSIPANQPRHDRNATASHAETRPYTSSTNHTADSKTAKRVYSSMGCGCYRLEESDTWNLCERHAKEASMSQFTNVR